MVRAEGWIDNSEINYIELAKRMEKCRSKDYCNIIAKVLKDIINLAELGMSFGAPGGKAIHTGSPDLNRRLKHK